MFRLKNVTRTYKLRSGRERHALDNISLTLPDRGMVFICGRSGSGKSTLLNILCGLDKPTGGDICYNDKWFSALSEEELADYRNYTVGFIFQDFALLEDNINVEQNIMIPLFLQGKKSNESVKGILKKVGLPDDFEKQRINELSGGEKQRIAIARALIKKPKIVLADEPTGNLDSATGKEIFDILKRMSRNCLVIVVTHDLESIKTYSDYVIELAEGKVIYNTCHSAEENETVKEDTTSGGILEHPVFLDYAKKQQQLRQKPSTKKSSKDQKQKLTRVERVKKIIEKIRTTLPFAMVAKMGSDNLKKKPFRTFGVIVMSILTIFCMTLAQLYLSYSNVRIHTKVMDEKKVNVFALARGDTNLLNYSSVNYLEDKYSGTPLLKQYSDIRILNSNGNGRYENITIIKRSKDILDFGFEFYGNYLELDENSVYIAEDYVEYMYGRTGFTIKQDDGSYEDILKERYPYSELLGKSIKYYYGAELDFTIAGIVKTKDLIFADDDMSKKFYRSNFTVSLFCLENHVNRNGINTMSLDYYKYNLTLRSNNGSFSSGLSFNITKAGDSYSDQYALVRGAVIKKVNSINLNPSELLISLNVYNNLFGSDLKIDDYIDIPDPYNGNVVVSHIPQYLEAQAKLSFSEVQNKKTVLSGDYKIAGITFRIKDNYGTPVFTDAEDTSPSIVLHQEKYLNIFNKANVSQIIVNKNKIKNVEKFLSALEKNQAYAQSPYSSLLPGGQDDFGGMPLVYGIFSVLLGIIMVFMIINTISLGIINRTRELGILKALGARNKDLFTIFLFETLIISLTIFIACISLSFLGAAFLNKIILSGDATFKIFFVDFFTVLTIFAASFVLIFLAALIPLMKIKKMNAVNAIKGIVN